MLQTFSQFAILLLIATPIRAADFYVDPEHGDPANDGSVERPWRSLQDVFTRGLIESRTWDSLPYNRDTRLVPKNAGAPVKAGDTIWLRTAYYGDLVIENYYNKDFVNHNDGFQSWTRGPKGVGSGEVVGIVLRGNTIINFEDPQQPHRGALQGIGCFDGMFVDWIIENNVVIVDHYHGITLGGARNCRIVNNTVIDPNDSRPGPAAIRIGKHKNGTPSSGCTIRNNLTNALHVQSGQDMTADHNLIIDDPASFFVDAAGRDLRLKKGSPAVDAGAADLAPKAGIAGTPRPEGRGVDIGAYELPAE